MNNKELSECILNRIKEIPISEYPRIGHLLNKWEFPEELIEFKPTHWELLQMDNQYEIICEPCRYIRKEIGEKEALRYLHVHDLGKSNEEFEEWYPNKPTLTDDAIKLLREIGDKNTNRN